MENKQGKETAEFGLWLKNQYASLAFRMNEDKIFHDIERLRDPLISNRNANEGKARGDLKSLVPYAAYGMCGFDSRPRHFFSTTYRSGKLGYECDVCWDFGDLRLTNLFWDDKATTSAVMGMDFSRSPSASSTALAMIGAAGIIVCSPMPRAPNGPSGWGVSMMMGMTSSGISIAVGIL